MRKIIFLILSIFTISSIGYSEIQNFNGIVFDDNIFGKTPNCKSIGNFYLASTTACAQKKYTRKTSQTIENNVTALLLRADSLIIKDGWNKFSSEIENINSYYKVNCKKIRIGDYNK